ncbi:MAG: hypothetical protein Q4D93_03920 [Porphyromonas sp.]|nr:hypothetical protein [Porphyromonas sp.]
MDTVLIVTLVAVAVAILLLGIRVFFTKRWGFPSSHVDGNKPLTDRGLSCHRHQSQEVLHHKNLAERLRAQKEL